MTRSLDERNIYADLLRECVRRGHHVTVASSVEKRLNEPTTFTAYGSHDILLVQTGNVTKTGLLEKGISTLTLQNRFIRAIKNHCRDIAYDLVLTPTPPVTFAKVISYVKKRDGAGAYLMLKDIFPQNAVDLGMFPGRGPIYAYFRRQEQALYRTSDFIGCMSEANVRYLLEHNPGLNASVEVCPNAVEAEALPEVNREEVLSRYGIPAGRTVFLYGGNLGRPQGVPFITRCLETQRGRDDRYFVICGSGTDYSVLEQYLKAHPQRNVKLIPSLPKAEYDSLAAACDIGLLFLDCRFTIPNFPSRLLTYLQCGKPVLACTDKNTDIRQTVQDNEIGYWCESRDPADFAQLADKLCDGPEQRARLGQNAYRLLLSEYTSARACDIILSHYQEPARRKETVHAAKH